MDLLCSPPLPIRRTEEERGEEPFDPPPPLLSSRLADGAATDGRTRGKDCLLFLKGAFGSGKQMQQPVVGGGRGDDVRPPPMNGVGRNGTY